VEAGIGAELASMKVIERLDGIEACGEPLVVDELERVELGKMNLQLVAKEQNQHRAQRGKNQAGGMVTFVSGARKYVRKAAE